MKKLVVILLILIGAVVVLPLAYNNAQIVEFNYFIDTFKLPLSWLLVATFSFGVLLALIFFAITGLVWRFRAKSLKKQVDELQKQRKRDDIAKQFHAEKDSEKKAS